MTIFDNLGRENSIETREQAFVTQFSKQFKDVVEALFSPVACTRRIARRCLDKARPCTLQSQHNSS